MYASARYTLHVPEMPIKLLGTISGQGGAELNLGFRKMMSKASPFYTCLPGAKCSARHMNRAVFNSYDSRVAVTISE